MVSAESMLANCHFNDYLICFIISFPKPFKKIKYTLKRSLSLILCSSAWASIGNNLHIPKHSSVCRYLAYPLSIHLYFYRPLFC